jgi:parallel beta-helix repeat protein
MGFDVGGGNTIQGCTASFNEGDGINLLNDSVARDNSCDSNGTGGDGAGIHVTNSDNRIEGNNVTDNDRGIHVDAPRNLIIKNSASGNSTNWEVVAANVILVINATVTGSDVSGDDGGSPPGSTDPNANFTY